MKISKDGVDLIKQFESLHDGDLKVIGLQPKLCPAGIWTVGYGRALIDPVSKQFLRGEQDKAQAFKMYPNLTEAQAEQFLQEDLVRYSTRTDRVINNIKRKLNENQYSALVSFVYNVGDGALAGSNLLRKISINHNDPTIKDEFLKWNKARVKGVLKVLNGLTKRRTAEANLYFKS